MLSTKNKFSVMNLVMGTQFTQLHLQKEETNLLNFIKQTLLRINSLSHNQIHP